MAKRPIFVEMDGDIVYADCPKCGGTNVKMLGFKAGNPGIEQAAVQCNICGHTETYGRRALKESK